MRFAAQETELPGVLLITHEFARDGRGFFAETFREEAFSALGLPRFVQDNHAGSLQGVLRGMHYQIRPAAIAKLVRCLRGRIFDVAVDIRRSSPTYGRWVGVELSENDCRMLYIPEGFAHGYLALTEHCEVLYKTSGYYAPECDRGFRWNDPDVHIAWPIDRPLLSPKDASAPLLRSAENNFD